MILAEGLFRLQLNKKQLKLFVFFTETCFEQRTDTTGNCQQDLPRDNMFYSSIISVARQSFSLKTFIKTLEIPMKFIKQLLKHLLNVLSFKYKRPPCFRVFCYGYKGEFEEEVKGRTTSIFSVAMLQNLNDNYSRD